MVQGRRHTIDRTLKDLDPSGKYGFDRHGNLKINVLSWAVLGCRFGCCSTDTTEEAVACVGALAPFTAPMDLQEKAVQQGNSNPLLGNGNTDLFQWIPIDPPDLPYNSRW
jgi:hypothetical protein